MIRMALVLAVLALALLAPAADAQQTGSAPVTQPSAASPPAATKTPAAPTTSPPAATKWQAVTPPVAPGKNLGTLNWWPEDLGDWATVAIALFTIVLAISTIGLWFVTHMSAKAALRTAKTISASERAYVALSHTAPGLAIDKDTGAVTVAVEARNSGRTPATVTEILLKLHWPPSSTPLPDTPNYHREGPIDDTIEAFLVTQGYVFNTRVIFMDPGALPDIKIGKTKLWLYGYVDYIDSFAQRHRGGFARIYEPNLDTGPIAERNNLVSPTIKNYNYDRLRKAGEGKDW